MIDKKIGFYTFFTDNQAILPAYVNDALALNNVYAVPHEGFWKTYKNGGVDFLQARGYLDFSQPNLWIALFYIGVFAGPTGTWAAVSVARALPPVTGSLGMLGTPLLGIASSVVLVGEQVTFSLMLGTALVIGGIAIVIFDRSR